jgi:probable HAF family extracellular repeat protein
MRRPNFLAALMIVTAPLIAHDGDQTRNDFEPATYCVYEIPRLPGLPPGEISLDIPAINNRNQVVGWLDPSGVSPTRAFIWDLRRGIRDLGSLPEHSSLAAADINDTGAVVGYAFESITKGWVAFIWTRHRGARVLDVSLGGSSNYATGINRRGQIVGTSQTETGAVHAYLRDVNGDVLDLGAFPDGSGDSQATAVNDWGQVVGRRGNAQITEGFLWDERRGMRPLLEESAPFVAHEPHDINNRGEVVGEFLVPVPHTTRAFRWTRRGGMQDLGSLNGLESDYATARAINRWGTIVGASQNSSLEVHGFVWRRETGMRDLNELIDPSSQLPSQVVLEVGTAINDFGSIAMVGLVPGEESRRAFLMVPQRHPHKACL